MKSRVIFLSLILLPLLTLPLFAQGHTQPFAVSIDSSMAGWPQVGYAVNMDFFLAVWEDYRNGNSDIYAQVLESNGAPLGDNFPLCKAEGDQFWPQLAYDNYWGRFLVVFEDWRKPKNGDIRGIFIRADGQFYHPPTADDDHSFLICANPGNIYTCSVAFNWREKVYLVVWGDFRNDPTAKSMTGADVYGQLISDTGELLPPPSPADSSQNFAIAADQDFYESVADVSYSPITNEFLVVYGTNKGLVLGQRVNHLGQLLTKDGSAAPANSAAAPFTISDQFKNGPDCLQAKVQFNSDFGTPQEGWCEAEVIWKGIHHPDRMDNDVWGQRIGFFREGDKFVAKYVSLTGDTSLTDRSNHSISNQKDFVGVAEIAYNEKDNEFLVIWGDPRNKGWAKQDLYGQRLWVHGTRNEMTFLADDRVNTVTDSENIPYFVSGDRYEGSLVGIAHGDSRNDFMVVYTYEDPLLGRESDIMGFRVHGNWPTGVTDRKMQPDQVVLHAGYPNPFNASTRIRFSTERDGDLALRVFDINGRAVATLLQEHKSAGEHQVDWHADGRPSGVYVIQLQAGDAVRNQKILLIK